MCCEAYVVSRRRRGDRYIGLYINDKIMQHVVSTPPSRGSIIIRSLNPLKKEVRKEVETSEKVWGYVAGEGKFENSDQEPLGPKNKPKTILKTTVK